MLTKPEPSGRFLVVPLSKNEGEYVFTIRPKPTLTRLIEPTFRVWNSLASYLLQNVKLDKPWVARSACTSAKASALASATADASSSSVTKLYAVGLLCTQDIPEALPSEKPEL